MAEAIETTKDATIDLPDDGEVIAGFMDNVTDCVYFKDREHRYVRVNAATARHAGCGPEEMIGRTDAQLLPGEQAEQAWQEEESVLASGQALRSIVRGLSCPTGVIPLVSVTKVPWRDRGGAIRGIIGITRDLSGLDVAAGNDQALGQIEAVLYRILAVSVRDAPLEDKLGEALRIVLAIPWLPLQTRGAILLAEPGTRSLRLVCQHDLPEDVARRCSRVPFGRCLCGRAAESRDVVFAAHADERHDRGDDEEPPHDHAHYCVPLLSRGVLVGVVALYLPAGHEARPEEFAFLRALGDALAGVVERSRAGEEAGRARQLQQVLADILLLSIKPIALREQLEQILDRVLSVEWLSLQAKGCIFLVDAATGTLLLEAQRGLHSALLEACARVPFGRCLCGRAAESGEVVFRSAVDHDHEIGYPGILPHGHYCVPIQSDGELLGVLNCYVRAATVRSPEVDGFLTSAAATIGGVVRRRRAEEALVRLATVDTVTGLPNRALCDDRLRHALAQARRYGRLLAVLFLDLDGFKAVNDARGHDVGDALLQAVGQRLAGQLRESDTVARLGGDEFAVVLTEVSAPGDAERVAERLLAAVSRPYTIGDGEHRVGVSIGIGLYPAHGTEPGALVRCADQAMYEAKRAGKGRIAVFRPPPPVD
ncbi:MAG: diguanylate cyclase [Deltaproteobacteria bacterium]|nr:diguanylate cyclase [Deltaproteobacteria bacterium]